MLIWVTVPVVEPKGQDWESVQQGSRCGGTGKHRLEAVGQVCGGTYAWHWGGLWGWSVAPISPSLITWQPVWTCAKSSVACDPLPVLNEQLIKLEG